MFAGVVVYLLEYTFTENPICEYEISEDKLIYKVVNTAKNCINNFC